MTPDTIPQSVLFPICSTSPSSPRSTRSTRVPTAGPVLLKAAERVYGLVKAFAGVWPTNAHRGRFGTRSRT